MGGWDYRVIRKVQDGFESYGIHEVYWRSDGTVEAITENPVIPYGETPEELKKDILMQLQGLDKPVLDFDLCKDQWDDGKIDP